MRRDLGWRHDPCWGGGRQGWLETATGANHDDSWRLNWYSRAWLTDLRSEERSGRCIPTARSQQEIPPLSPLLFRHSSFYAYLCETSFLPSSSFFPSVVYPSPRVTSPRTVLMDAGGDSMNGHGGSVWPRLEERRANR